MYCYNCKKEVEDGKFCRYCGNSLNNNKIINVIMTILIIIYVLYLVLVLPYLWCTSASDAVGGLLLFIGPPYMFITCCVPITISIGVINTRKNKRRKSIIALILYIVSFFLLIYFSFMLLGEEMIDAVDLLVLPILLLFTITILSIINIIKNK